MTKDDDRKPAMPNPSQRGELSGFTPEAVEWMRNRTRDFQRFTTSGPGKRDKYGTGIPPAPKKPKKT